MIERVCGEGVLALHSLSFKILHFNSNDILVVRSVTWVPITAYFNLGLTLFRLLLCPGKGKEFRYRDVDRQVYTYLCKKPATVQEGFVMTSKPINSLFFKKFNDHE